jgi:hypothetical protein
MTATLTTDRLIDFTATNGFGEPIEFEGTCGTCAGVYLLDDHGRLPEHKEAGGRLDRPHCDASVTPGRDPHRRRPFFVEGVRFL